jgi:hypothetical protein
MGGMGGIGGMGGMGGENMDTIDLDGGGPSVVSGGRRADMDML